ncbi:MAG: GTA-gp10 family protein [Pseudomonadota bacterium]
MSSTRVTDTHHHGDAYLEIDGARQPLRLTLGALADIEEELGGDGFEALSARLSRPSAGDILFILHALLRGAGVEVSIAALRASGVDLGAAARAISAAFSTLGVDAGSVKDTGLEAAPGKVQAPEGVTPSSPGATGSSSR